MLCCRISYEKKTLVRAEAISPCEVTSDEELDSRARAPGLGLGHCIGPTPTISPHRITLSLCPCRGSIARPPLPLAPVRRANSPLLPSLSRQSPIDPSFQFSPIPPIPRLGFYAEVGFFLIAPWSWGSRPCSCSVAPDYVDTAESSATWDASGFWNCGALGETELSWYGGFFEFGIF